MSVPRGAHSAHRQAFGPRRTLSPATKARHVAKSIVAREREQRAWSSHDFGLDVESAQWQLVLKALGALRAKQAA